MDGFNFINVGILSGIDQLVWTNFINKWYLTIRFFEIIFDIKVMLCYFELIFIILLI